MRQTLKVAVLLAFCLLTARAWSAEEKSTSIRWPADNVALNLEFDTENHTVTGTADISVAIRGPKRVGFLLNKDFTVNWVKVNGYKCDVSAVSDYDVESISNDYGIYGNWDPAKATLYIGKIPRKGFKDRRNTVINVNYTGTMYAPPDERKFSREEIAMEVDGSIGQEGIFLSSSAFWHPVVPDSPAPYKVTARIPAGWNCVTDGASSDPVTVDGWTEVVHTSNYKVTGVNFAAGPYEVQSVDYNGIKVSTYFLPPQASLAEGYLEAAQKFIGMYSEMIGPYNFPKFAIVDNFLPSGYGMPGWTLLGSEVIRLPFIKETSLGHEILHCWFGNGIQVDYREGNWCEGLTALMADQKYKADKDPDLAAEYRAGILKDYASYVDPSNDYPLNKFHERANMTDRAIGYGKVAMTFHMLKQMFDMQDSTVFVRLLQKAYKDYNNKPMGWRHWRQLTNQFMGANMEWFFTQWVDMTGAPMISIEDAEYETFRTGWEAWVLIQTQGGSQYRPYSYMLTVRGMTDRGPFDTNVLITQPEQWVLLEGTGNLEYVRADPDYNTFRVLYPEEQAITLSAFIGDKDGILVVPARGPKASQYREAAEGLKGKGQQIITDIEFNSEMMSKSLWLFGTPEENDVVSRYQVDADKFEFLSYRPARWKEEEPGQQGFGIKSTGYRGGALTATVILPNPRKPENSLVLTASLPEGNPVSGARKVNHYGKYSYLIFEGDENVLKGAWAAGGDSPMVWMFDQGGFGGEGYWESDDFWSGE